MTMNTDQENRDWDILLRLMNTETCLDPSMTDKDWMDIVSMAQRLGIASLLYDRLKRRSVIVPSHPLSILHAAYLHTAMRNTRVYHFLDEILTALSTNKIPVIVMKGAYLAKGVYDNIAVRPMGDVDVLVHNEHLGQTANIFCNLGYIPSEPINDSEMHKRHHLPTFSKPNGIKIEVHGSETFIGISMPLPRDELTNLWNRVREFMLGDQSVYVFSPEDQLLYLCLHASISHCFVVDLRPFFDIAEIICYYKEELDWQIVFGRAKQWRVENAAKLVLYLAYTWAIAEVPQAMISTAPARISDHQIVEYIRYKVLNAPHENLTVVFSKCLSEKVSPLLTLDLSAFIGRFGYTFRSRPLINSLFPSYDIIMRQYPEAGDDLWQVRFCYLIRVFDLMKRYCKVCYYAIRRRLIITSTIRMEQSLRRLIFGEIKGSNTRD